MSDPTDIYNARHEEDVAQQKQFDDQELFEKLAAIEHERWSGWQKYLHSVCSVGFGGTLLIPAKFVEGWERQIDTPYAELSETEKESDRDQVRRYWSLIVPDTDT